MFIYYTEKRGTFAMLCYMSTDDDDMRDMERCCFVEVMLRRRLLICATRYRAY